MKNLDSYKKSLGNRVAFLTVLISVALIASLVLNFYMRDAVPDKQNITDYAVGFFTGIEIMAVFFIGKLYKTRSTPEALRTMYLKEYDERNILIRTKSGFPLIVYLSTVLFLIALGVGYVSYTSFLTITIIAIGQILVSLVLKLYWSRKL